ncbi:MAG: DUF5131 family protein [bacterium]|nr:DUF5131 family protein [bacterium]
MGKTKIPWADEASNPLKVRRVADGKLGWYCRKISPACLHCYSSTMNERQGTNPGRHGTGHSFKLSEAQHLEPVLIQKELDRISRARKPRRWFVCDMTDIALQVGQCLDCGAWREGACASCGITPPPRFWPQDFIFRCFDAWLEAAGNGQTIQILTKRPAQLRRLLGSWQERRGLIRAPDGWWVGVSAGTQDKFDEMVDELGRIAAQVHFASVEPQTERIDPSPERLSILGQVIQGGESGAGARPFHLEWARTMRDACKAAGVAYFFKQSGSNAYTLSPPGKPGTAGRWPTPHHRAGEDPRDWPADLQGCRAFPETT